MSSSNGTILSPPSMSHSNESTDDKQWISMGSTLGDSTEDNQSILQDLSDDEPRLKRKVPFRGFTNGSQEDMELLSAIEQVKNGFAPRYTTLSEGACKKRWEVHQTLVRQYEATLKTATGIAPFPSAYMERMRRIVDTANAFKERADDRKLERSKKKEEFQQRYAMAEEMRRLATQRLGKRIYAMLEHSDTQRPSNRTQRPNIPEESRSSTTSSSSNSSSSPFYTSASSSASSSRPPPDSDTSDLANTAASNSHSGSHMSRDEFTPIFNVSSESSANTGANGTVHSSSSSRSSTLIDIELQKLQSDSDAVIRHMEAESQSRRTIEDTLLKLTAAIENDQKANRNTLQKLATTIENDQKANRDTLQRLTTTIENDRRANQSMLQKLTVAIEGGQQVNLQILQVLKELKSGN
ncbi:hypothetical protein FBU30_011286 [Linnemannia zychae]|nr:hypothetical protein FBU30_011286 [Linnemannia zychae]